jgi:hypothetical protein
MKQFTDFKVIENMSMEEYLAHPYYDNHRLGQAQKSLKKLHWSMRNNNPKALTNALKIGTLIHMAILEPEKFDAMVRLLPDGNKNSVEWKKAVVEQFSELELDSKLKPNELEKAISEAYPSMEIMTQAEYNTCINMRDVAYSSLGSLLRREKMCEFVVLCKHISTGLNIKIRPDLYVPSLGYGVDLKTTEDASPYSFKWDIHKYSYHRSFALYSDVLRDLYDIKKYRILAFEKNAPYEYAFYNIDEELFLSGRKNYEDAMAKIAKAIDTNEWTSYVNDDGKPEFTII